MATGAGVPDLPEPAHADLDSMLTRRFGKEVANYFSGSPLNRLSFLRTDRLFLSAAVTHPTASFVLFNNLAPLCKDPSRLAYVKHADVQSLIGDNPYSQTQAQVLAAYNSAVAVPQLVFLGIDEKREADGLRWKELYRGAPYFALDVTPKGAMAPRSEGVIAEMRARGLSFVEGRMHTTLPADDAAIYAQSRAYLDWNARNPFCAQCGHATLSINGGAKRTCPPTDLSQHPTLTAHGSSSDRGAIDSRQRPPCATRQGVHNIAFPRTDPTIIVAVVSPDGQRVLLGRQKRWPPHLYSTLAGFVEPAESVEDAVRREVWEESGVVVGRVVLHGSQPWPYPANLMLGAIAHAVPGQDQILLRHDPELEHARWVPLPELADALRSATIGLREDPLPPLPDRAPPAALRLPPQTAIANRLLTAVVDGFVAGPGAADSRL
ncbi:MAG: NADH pyrophosphatase [Phylliscum demangeonii]|nr:MAG: NADH pyrophosphatase [Phylliscum demangeonii]